jgi:hypothetical protein
VGFAPFCKDRPTQLETAGLQAGAAYGRCARMAQPYLVEGQPALDGCFLAVKRTVNRATPDLTVILIEGEERQGRAQLTATRFFPGRCLITRTIIQSFQPPPSRSDWIDAPSHPT